MNYQKIWNQLLMQEAETTIDPDATPINKAATDNKKKPSGPLGINAFFKERGLYLDKFLGGGKDGKVYRALNEKTGQAFAVKLIGFPEKVSQSGTDPRREVENYRFVMEKRESFGEYAKYLPVVYASEVVAIPDPSQPASGKRSPFGMIIMEELSPLPPEVARGLFATSSNLKGVEQAMSNTYT